MADETPTPIPVPPTQCISSAAHRNIWDIIGFCTSTPDWNQVYCCSDGHKSGFVVCNLCEKDENNKPVNCTEGQVGKQVCNIGLGGINLDGSNTCFPPFTQLNLDGTPLLKSPLNGTAMSPFVKIAFEEYCSEGGNIDVSLTKQTVLTMGNKSQPGSEKQCRASIKAFQYGWGSQNEGCKCVVTIIDDEGGEFENWVQRLGKNPEGMATPITGQYRMVVQMGWYVEGGGDGDICGQPTSGPNIQPIDGENHSFLVCSPLMYFMPFVVSTNFEGQKFIYELEGVDLLVRSQEHMQAKVVGEDSKKKYFVQACQELGLMSTPPFRVEFLARDCEGKLQRMKFVTRPGQPQDSECWGPYDVWPTYERPPLSVIHEWIRLKNMRAKNLCNTGSEELGITLNYDPTYVWNEDEAQCVVDPCPPPPECTGPLPPPHCDPLPTEFCQCEGAPQYGRLLLWAVPLPYCRNNFTDNELNSLMSAVYINSGPCSPVIAFNPVIKWHPLPINRASSSSTPLSGRQGKTSDALALLQCNINGGRGNKVTGVAHSSAANLLDAAAGTVAIEQSKTIFHQNMANSIAHAIEAELRVQGDPSNLYCSPIFGAGRTVGMVFINPQYLSGENGVEKCPEWSAQTTELTPGVLTETICNKMLTNRSWFIKGADHQIRDGSYITTIKLMLPLPGSELNDAGSIVNVGGDPLAITLPFGGQFAVTSAYPVGESAAKWFGVAGSDPKGCDGLFVGAGEDTVLSSGDPDNPSTIEALLQLIQDWFDQFFGS